MDKIYTYEDILKLLKKGKNPSEVIEKYRAQSNIQIIGLKKTK